VFDVAHQQCAIEFNRAGREGRLVLEKAGSYRRNFECLDVPAGQAAISQCGAEGSERWRHERPKVASLGGLSPITAPVVLAGGDRRSAARLQLVLPEGSVAVKRWS